MAKLEGKDPTKQPKETKVEKKSENKENEG
jgi:hypothetical protein